MAEISSGQAFLLTRRSRPYKLLSRPAPPRPQIEVMLRIASRTPDHGKLEPWRFVVIEEAALRRIAKQARDAAARLGVDPDKAAHAYEITPFAIAVIESPVESDKVPPIEQSYSAGAVCLALLNAALAGGWGANWLSGAVSHEARFASEAFGVQAHERIAGIIHMGTVRQTPPDRPRPDLNAKTRWMRQ